MKISQTTHNYQNAYDQYWSKEANPEFVKIRDAFKPSKSAAKAEAELLFTNDIKQYLNIANKFEDGTKIKSKLNEWAWKFSEKYKGIKLDNSKTDYMTDLGDKLGTFASNHQTIKGQDLYKDKQKAKKALKQDLKPLFKSGKTPDDIRKIILEEMVAISKEKVSSSEEKVVIGTEASYKIDYFYKKYTSK